MSIGDFNAGPAQTASQLFHGEGYARKYRMITECGTHIMVYHPNIQPAMSGWKWILTWLQVPDNDPDDGIDTRPTMTRTTEPDHDPPAANNGDGGADTPEFRWSWEDVSVIDDSPSSDDAVIIENKSQPDGNGGAIVALGPPARVVHTATGHRRWGMSMAKRMRVHP